MDSKPTDQFTDPKELATVLGAIEALGRAVNTERAKLPDNEAEVGERIYSPLLEREDNSVAFTNRRGGVISVVRPTGGRRGSSPAKARSRYAYSAMSQSLRAASDRDQSPSPAFWPAAAAMVIFAAAIIGMAGVAWIDSSVQPSAIEPRAMEAVPLWISSDEAAEEGTADNPAEFEQWQTSFTGMATKTPSDPSETEPPSPRAEKQANRFFVSTWQG